MATSDGSARQGAEGPRLRPGRLLGLLLGAVLLWGCDPPAVDVPPSVRVEGTTAFSRVRLGGRETLSLSVFAETRAPVQVNAARLESAGDAAALGAFSISGVPLTVPALGRGELQVTFAPQEARLVEALLVLETNDPTRKEVTLVLLGEGAAGELTATPVCEAAGGCRGTVTLAPPAVDFGPEVFGRQVPRPLAQLPAVVLTNPGPVDVLVRGLELSGPDAAAFSVAADVFTDQGPDGRPALVLPPARSVIVPLRFTPTAPDRAAFEGLLRVRSDAEGAPELSVALRGQLQPNAPPDVCANLTAVRRNGQPIGRGYGAEADWAPLRAPPAGGVYDFSATGPVPALRRDVRTAQVSRENPATVFPTEVTLSALSPPGDGSACTRDPDTGLQGLRMRWGVVRVPDGAAPPTFRNGASEGGSVTLLLGPQPGPYEVRLDVDDPQGGPTVSRTLRFVALPAEDLVVELSWRGASGTGGVGVDLDLHVVRPTTAALPEAQDAPLPGLFAWFDELPPGGGVLAARVSGDVNGRAKAARGGFEEVRTFDWGREEEGVLDDPFLPFDDRGEGARQETLYLDSPENDPACERAECRYPVYAHYFADRRTGLLGDACTVTGAPGCGDGERCTCPAGRACVAVTRPEGELPSGPGLCTPAPEAQLRVLAGGREVTVPLAAMPSPVLGAPCQAVHVADVVWPPRLLPDGGVATPSEPSGTPRVEAGAGLLDGGTPRRAHYGQRDEQGECVGNREQPGNPAARWYGPVGGP